MSADFTPSPPRAAAIPVENLKRGAIASLATIPVGVAVWMVLWGYGFIASLVGWLVAFLATRLYVWGAGRLSRPGAMVVVAVTVVTLLLAFFGGVVLDAANGIGDASGLSSWGAFTHEQFWPTFWNVLPTALPDYLPDFAWAIGFGALGSFTTLRAAFTAARRVTAAPPIGTGAPTAPDAV